MYVCKCRNNSATPEANSTKLGTLEEKEKMKVTVY